MKHELPPVYPKIDVASALTISRHYTEEALKNVHTQISDLVRTHVAGPEQAGVFFNTILPMTCSFQHQMDEMAINLLFPGSQLVPNVWSACREVLEGLSLVAPPSCSASWPASLVERVAPIPGTSGQSGSAKTPTKPGNPGANKLTPGSRKKTGQSNKLPECSGVTRRKERRKVQTPGLKRRSVRRNPPDLFSPWMNTSILLLSSPTGLLPVGPHSHLKLHLPPYPFRIKPRKDPVAVPDPSDDEPLSDQANEPKAKARKRDPTPELVVVGDDDSTPLPGKQKTPKKSLPAEEEATEKLVQRLKGEARGVQYNLELSVLVDYRNKFIPNLRGPPNTDDHSKYLSQVRDISLSYPAKGNLWTARQYFPRAAGL